METWDAPVLTENGWDRTPSTRTELVWLTRRVDLHDSTDRGESNHGSLGSTPACQTRSDDIDM